MSEERPTLAGSSLATDIAGLSDVPLTPEQAQAPPTWLEKLPDISNPFAARLRQNPDLGTVTLGERARLNALDSYYRGTIAGSLHLKTLGDVAAGGAAVDPNTGQPHPYLNQETAKRELEQIRDDLARYESMPSFKGPIEGAAALAGTLSGGAISPESWITRFPGAAAAASWLGKFAGESASAMASRIFDTAISQGAVQVVTDPVAQAGALSTGINQDYDIRRTALAFPLGAIFGGVLGAGHEAANVLLRGRIPSVSRETLRPEAASETPRETVAPETTRLPPTEPAVPTPQIVPGETPGTFRTEVTINGQRTVIEGPTREGVAAAIAERAAIPVEVPITRAAEVLPSEAARIVGERAVLGREDPSTRIVPNTPAADVERERLQNVAQQDAIAAAGPTDEAKARAVPEIQAAASGAQRYQPPLPPAAPAGAPAAPSDTLRTLHQMSFDLAEMVNTPLRQGRMAKTANIGQYDASQDVIRQRVIGDFDTAAHEVGHALEDRVGPELTALTQRHAAELGPLDYEPRLARVNEGFAEWFQHYLKNPAAAQREAPGFYGDFRDFMARKEPELAAKIDQAQATYKAWLDAPPTAKLETIVQRQEPETITRSIREDGFAPTVSLWVRRFYQGAFDENAPWTRAVRSIARAAHQASGVRMDIPAYRDPDQLVRLNTRAIQMAQEAMSLGVTPYHGSGFGPQGSSLRDVLNTAHGARTVGERFFGRWNDRVMTDLDSYLAARQLELDWRRYDAGDLPNIPAALNRAEVAEAITRLEAAYPTFLQAADEFTAYARQLLRKQFEAGLLERATYERIIQQPFYAPLNRVLDDQPLRAPGISAGAPGTPMATELIRKKQGSMRDIISPVQSIQAQTFAVERAIAHNDTVKAIVTLAREARQVNAAGIGQILEEIPPHEIVGRRFELAEAIEAAGRQNGIKPDDLKVLLSSVVDIFGDDPVMGSIFRAAPARPRGEPITFWREGGELRAVRIGDDYLDLYQRMTSLPPAMRDIALTWLAVSSTALRQGVTKNPIWMLTNFFKDQLAASILHPGYVPFNPRGIYRTLADDGWTSAYARVGGLAPGLASAEMEQTINHSIDALARRGYSVQVLGSLRDALPFSGRPQKIRGLARAFGNIVSISETGTRMNIFERVFEQKKRQGLGDYEAAVEAAAQSNDLLDLGRHGSRTLAIRSLWTFLNSNMQALDKARRQFIVPLYRAASGGMFTKQDQEAARRAAYSWMIAGAAMPAAGYAWGLLFGKDEIYQDADAKLRATHLVIPGKKFGLDHDIVLAPKPFELAMGWNLGEAAGLKVATGDQRAFDNAMLGIAEVLLPPSWDAPIAGLRTTNELQLNRSFFTGREIVRGEEQGRPSAQQFRPSTSDVAKAIGAAVGMSPLKIDYAAGGYFGSLGRDIIHMGDAFDANAPDIPPENTMFLRRLIKSADISSQTTQTFWRLAAQQNGEYVGAKNAYDMFIQQLQDKNAMEFLAQLPAEKRAYVTLQSAANESGRPAFKADEKNLHPLTRAAKAVSLINGMVDQLNVNAQAQIDKGETLVMNSTQRRDAIDGLRQIQAMEQRNALVILGERGYEGRKLLSVEDEFAVLRSKLPVIAAELADRYATERIYKTAEIATAWPQAQRRLLGEGGAADLNDLALDVRSAGPAFEGARVYRPERRRMVEIPALPPAVAATLAR